MTQKKHLETRSNLVRAVRQFFFVRDYLEVETPVRIRCPIPEAHIDPFESESFTLQASPEIFMKQLLASGYHRIFQIARVFRKDEQGQKHLPEFSLLEWYTAGTTYLDIMDQLEALILEVASELKYGQNLQYRDDIINIKPPWNRLTVKEAFEKYSSTTLQQALETDSYDEVMGLEIEPHLGFGKPLFLYDYPAAKASLARLKPGNPQVAERVELYIAGLELANGFTELCDPVEQRLRFEAEHQFRSRLGKNNYPLPETFLDSLSTLPECSGIAAGLDRIVMLFCNAVNIEDVVAFTPHVM